MVLIYSSFAPVMIIDTKGQVPDGDNDFQIKWFDKDGHIKDLTDSSETMIVGANCALKAVETGTSKIKTIKWSGPSLKIFKKYHPSAAEAKLIEIADSDRKSVNFNFYWAEDSDAEAKVTANVIFTDGTTKAHYSIFKVLAPKIVVTAKTTAYLIDDIMADGGIPKSGKWMVFGSYSQAKAGIEFTRTVFQEPAGFEGGERGICTNNTEKRWSVCNRKK